MKFLLHSYALKLFFVVLRKMRLKIWYDISMVIIAQFDYFFLYMYDKYVLHIYVICAAKKYQSNVVTIPKYIHN